MSSSDYMRVWRLKNAEKVKEYARKYRVKNRARLRVSTRKHTEAWRKRNPEKQIESRERRWVYLLLMNARGHAKRRGHPVPTITVEWILERFQQTPFCPYLGLRLVPPTPKVPFNPYQVSLDRLDNDVGYTPENTVLTSWFWNSFRKRSSVSDALKLVRAIAKTIVEKTS